MAKIKKLLWVSVSGISGLLLTLAGIQLIQISNDLILYTGLGLLTLSILFYILPEGKKPLLSQSESEEVV